MRHAWPLAILVAGCSSSSSSPPSTDETGVTLADSATAIDTSADTGSVDATATDASVDETSPSTETGLVDTGTPPPACGDAGCPLGTWTSVTPAAIDPSVYYGPASVQLDPDRPQDLYTLFPTRGVWKSTDYGATWSGPINTGTNGTTLNDCKGYVKVAPHPLGAGATLYVSCIEGSVGFWKSTNGGVDWTNPAVLPNGGAATAVNQQFYPATVDPYDSKHLLMAAHGADELVESVDAGETWTEIARDPGMNGGSTYGINFVDTGDAATTRKTWLCLSAGAPGTWRTTNGGANWAQVQTNQHPAGVSSIFQPAPGVVFMAGLYSSDGDGVFRSSDDGATWSRFGANAPERVIFQTKRHSYAMYGWACGPGCDVDPNLEIGDPTGMGTWTLQTRPTGMSQGPAEAIVTSDGTHTIIVTANYNAGLWRYLEPEN